MFNEFIPHLPGSLVGSGNYHIGEGQPTITTIKTRDRHDLVIVQEKPDGSNVSAAKVNGKILAIKRAGYIASTSPYEHQFKEILQEEIPCGSLICKGSLFL